MVQERAEGPKAPEAARPERAEAPSPGQRPGYDGKQGDRFASVITQGAALG